MKRGRPAPAMGLLRQADGLARGAFPAASTALLMLLAAVPVGLPGLAPAVALSCVFFWSVFRPAALPPPAAFGLGLLEDLLTAAPVGAGVLTLLVAGGLATRWRPVLARQSFLAVWLAFCGVALGAAALGWLLQVALGWGLIPPAPAFYQVMLTAGLYPSLAGLLTPAHEAMTRAETAP